MAGKPKRISKSTHRRPKRRQETPPILPPPASLDATRLKQLYSSMLGSRMITERARVLVSQGVLPEDVSFAPGHEAIEIGALINLGKEDCVASGRQFVARFVQGIPLSRVFAELCAGQGEGHQPAPATSRSVDMVLPKSSFSVRLNLAMGAAWAFKLQRRPQVAVALSCGHSHAIDPIRDAVNFSAAYQLPIVHIVETSADSDSRARLQGPDAQDARARYSGLPCFVVDGSDVVAVYRVAQEAIRRVRQGHGPALIECRASAAAAPARTASAGITAFEDPLAKMEAHLRARGLWSDRWKMQLAQKFARELDGAVDFACRTLEPPPPTRHAASSSPARNANWDHRAKTGESSVVESPVIRDTGRLAGSRG